MADVVRVADVVRLAASSRSSVRFWIGILVLAVMLLPPAGTAAWATPLPQIPPPIKGTEQLMEAQDLIYSESGDSRRIERTIEAAQRAFERAGTEAEQHYWMARSHLLHGLYLNRQGQKRPAIRELDRTFDRIDQALAYGEFSEGLRVKADAHFQMANARSFAYMIRFGVESREQALTAYDLAPDNEYAGIALAGFYLNAPGAAGGDVAKGLEVLERLAQRQDLHRSNEFLVNVWLATGYNKQGRDTDASRHYYQAREIYPNSRTLAELGNDLGLN